MKKEKSDYKDKFEKARRTFLCLFFCLFFIIFLIIVVFIINIKERDSLLNKFYDFIDLSVVQVNIGKKNNINKENKKKQEEFIQNLKDEKGKNQYSFNVEFKNISSEDIILLNTIDEKCIERNKIAPGTSGSFSIILTSYDSTANMNYKINFVDETNEKPNNLTFKIRGNDKRYNTLQELEKDLKGVIKSNSKLEKNIDWQWNYETGNNKKIINANDKIDTNNSKELNSYKFRINVTGEEI